MCIRDRPKDVDQEEMRIARETTGTRSEELKHILSGEEIIVYQDLVRRDVYKRQSRFYLFLLHPRCKNLFFCAFFSFKAV